MTQLCEHMVRVTLSSDLIADFPSDCAGAHLKLVVPGKGESDGAFEAFVSKANFKTEMRTYTIRHIRRDVSEIDVDIVAHGDLGRVGPWSRRTRPGDVIVISRCGSPKLITRGINRVLAAADLAGFPALAAGLETLSADVVVDAFVEIPTVEDRPPVELAGGARLNWIVNPHSNEPSADLIAAIKAAPPPDANTSVFVAAEFATVATLRADFRGEHGVNRDRLYASSYWKAGADEPTHKIAKAAAA
ncbi:MAG: siderophore-interacting protein [Pseudomonadota bacterium]